MGDVAMTVPVLHSLRKAYPDTSVVVLTTYGYDPMFDNLPGVHMVHFDRHGKDKGLKGVFRVWWKLKRHYQLDAVADLHNVLRSRLLTFLLRFSFRRIPIVHISKERSLKRKLTKVGYKSYGEHLKSSFDRYRDVFGKLGYKFKMDFDTIFWRRLPEVPEDMIEIFGKKDGQPWVGVAPFAGHRSKVYPMKKMEEVVKQLSERGVKVFLFGHGRNEKNVLYSWQKKYDNVFAMPPETYLPQELILMAHLDVMVSMDSANMHMASMVATPVVSVWGATHPYAGFMGWKQSEDNAVQLPLECRPCSVFGEKPCRRNDKGEHYECVRGIAPEMIVEKVIKVLGENPIKQN